MTAGRVSVRLGVSPDVNALAPLFLAVVFVLVAIAFWLMPREELRRHPLPLPPPRARVEEGLRYFAAIGSSSAYMSGSTVRRHVSWRGKIFSIARAE